MESRWHFPRKIIPTPLWPPVDIRGSDLDSEACAPQSSFSGSAYSIKEQLPLL
jgi:hypothetical protein